MIIDCKFDIDCKLTGTQRTQRTQRNCRNANGNFRILDEVYVTNEKFSLTGMRAFLEIRLQNEEKRDSEIASALCRKERAAADTVELIGADTGENGSHSAKYSSYI